MAPMTLVCHRKNETGQSWLRLLRKTSTQAKRQTFDLIKANKKLFLLKARSGQWIGDTSAVGGVRKGRKNTRTEVNLSWTI